MLVSELKLLNIPEARYSHYIILQYRVCLCKSWSSRSSVFYYIFSYLNIVGFFFSSRMMKFSLLCHLLLGWVPL